jgi:quercetin dioxygenase-like cupin family protein
MKKQSLQTLTLQLLRRALIEARSPDSDSAAERPADHDNGRVIRAFGQEARVLVSSEQTRDAFCVLRFFIPPGNVTPPHLHRATDETFLIESGEIEINRGGELLRGRRGDAIYLPKGIPHALRVGNNEGVTLVVCVVPGSGFDRFFAACAEEFKKGEPEMPLLVKLAAEYGIEFQSGPAA